MERLQTQSKTTTPEYVADAVGQPQEVAGSVELPENRLLATGIAGYARPRSLVSLHRTGAERGVAHAHEYPIDGMHTPMEPDVPVTMPLLVEQAAPHVPLPESVQMPATVTKH
jgi:hypothetical protein